MGGFTLRTSLGSLAFVSLLVGCAVDDPELSEISSAARCSMCDKNGLPPDHWIAAPAELAPAAFGAAGLRVGPGVRPFCRPGSIVPAPLGGRRCDLDPQWANWIGAGTSPAVRERRDALLRYMIKVAARQVDSVVFSPWATVPGGFGLAPSALDIVWDFQTQSLITAGMAVAVDADANTVDICMKTRFTPDCPPSFAYSELAGVGNLFAGHLEMVVGGYDAERPEDSRRVCPPWGPTYTTCNTYSMTAAYHDMRCVYAGPWTQRFPDNCTPPGATVPMMFAVQVFTEFDPALPGSSGASGPRL
jgi:hypothetical protein